MRADQLPSDWRCRAYQRCVAAPSAWYHTPTETPWTPPP